MIGYARFIDANLISALGWKAIFGKPAKGNLVAQEWYYRIDDRQHGPVSAAELKQLAATRKLRPGDLVQKQGMDKWVPARSVKGLFPAESDAPPSVLPKPVAPAEQPKPIHDEAEDHQEPPPLPPPLPKQTLPNPEEDHSPPPLPPVAPTGVRGFFGKLKNTVQQVKDTVQQVKDTVQKATGSPPPVVVPNSQFPLLERAGLLSVVRTHLICKQCQTKIKQPPPELGRMGVCPGCKSEIKLPLRANSIGHFVEQLAEILQVDPKSPTIHQALAHTVEVLHPTSGRGGVLSFLQMKVIADQIRENSLLRFGKTDESELIALLAKGVGREIIQANQNDPIVQMAGTPCKLFSWLVNEQFNGCHSDAHFEGSVGHSNPDVNFAWFTARNNEVYPDDPFTGFSSVMLNNLLEIALAHVNQVRREQAFVAERQAAYQPISASVSYGESSASTSSSSGPSSNPSPVPTSFGSPSPPPLASVSRRPPAVALLGAVILEDDDGLFVFQKKCERCGRLDSGRTRSQKTGGVLSGTFACVACGNQQQYKIKTD